LRAVRIRLLCESQAFIAVSFLFLICGSVHAQTNTSVYTPLDPKQCRTLQADSSEGGSYLGRCPGTSGYTLLVAEGDLRQNITVVTPRGKKHSLELWQVVSGGFSSLGPKAEWRIRLQKGKSVPVALIVRYNASENPEDSTKTTSYLAVAKITPEEICVTDKISPGTSANEDARRAADVATTRACLKTQD
jgi:hypothetical protein